jgi:hypothetical protein
MPRRKATPWQRVPWLVLPHADDLLRCLVERQRHEREGRTVKYHHERDLTRPGPSDAASYVFVVCSSGYESPRPIDPRGSACTKERRKKARRTCHPEHPDNQGSFLFPPRRCYFKSSASARHARNRLIDAVLGRDPSFLLPRRPYIALCSARDGPVNPTITYILVHDIHINTRHICCGLPHMIHHIIPVPFARGFPDPATCRNGSAGSCNGPPRLLPSPARRCTSCPSSPRDVFRSHSTRHRMTVIDVHRLDITLAAEFEVERESERLGRER